MTPPSWRRQGRWIADNRFAVRDDDGAVVAGLVRLRRGQSGIPSLVALLKDEDVKGAVPWSLGEIGDKSAVPALKEALGDNSLTMRASALLALEKLERDTPDQSGYRRSPY